MHGAAPAVNAHGGPAMAGQIGTPGTGLDAPQDTRAAAMPGARRSTAGDLFGAITSRQTSLAVSESDRLRSPLQPIGTHLQPLQHLFDAHTTANAWTSSFWYTALLAPNGQ